MVVKNYKNQFFNYIEIGAGCIIDGKYDTDAKHGEIVGWELYIAPNHHYANTSKESFIDTLTKVRENLDLKRYVKNKTKVDHLIIYTNNLMKIKGFFNDMITDEFSDKYIVIMDVFEFRCITRWYETDDPKEMAEYAQTLIDSVFIPEKSFFLTPNQVPRKRLVRTRNDNTAQIIFPKSFYLYKMFRNALYGGLLYVPYKNLVIEEPLISIDLTSAYIYDLIVEKHCMTEFEPANTDNWSYYLDSTTMTSIGYYRVSYTCSSNKINCFKDEHGNKLEKGEHEVYITMTSIDLKSFMQFANVIDIHCVWLYACKLDYIPKYVIDEVVTQYIKKVSLKDNKMQYDLQKPILNGIFGDCIKTYTADEFNKAKKRPTLAPQWGIWCTSYARRNLFKLANKLEGWVYSATDSVYCNDCQYNIDLVEQYNTEVRTKLKEFCNKFGYDYEMLKDLGTFKVEKHIKKFKAVAPNVYMYTTTDNEFVLKAAGLDQSIIKVDESLYDKRIPYGRRLYKEVKDDCYYEEWRGGISNMLYTTVDAALQKPQY